MSALNEVAKLLKTFTPTTKVNWGKEKEEQGFYVFETLLSNTTQIQNTSRIQVLYKHKATDISKGMLEASEIIRSLKTHLGSIIYNDNCVYVGTQNDFYIYSLNFNVDETKQ